MKKRFRTAVFLLLFAGIVLTVFRYFKLVSKTVYEESVSHLTEVFHQSDNMLRELTDKNLTYLHMWGAYLQETSDEDKIRDYIENAQKDAGFLNFYFLSTDGNYKMLTGETGYLDLQENFEDEIQNGNDIVTNAVVPGKSQILVFASPRVHGNYQGFGYDAIAIAYENSDIVNVLDISAFHGNAKSYVVHPDGRVVVDHSFREWGNAYNFFGVLREHSNIPEKEILELSGKFKAGDTGAMLVNLDGKKHYLVYEKSEIQDWVFLGLVKAEIVNASMNVLQHSTMMLAGIVALSVAGLFIWLILRKSRVSLKKKDTEILYREELFQKLSMNVDDVFLMLDAKTYQADYVSPNVEKLMGMITQLLELQKTELHAEECLKVSPYDIKAYLEEKMAEFHLAAMQKSVGIELEVEPDMPKVWIDREKMDHIIDNLLSNALKYTEKGVIHILVKTARKKWTIEVKDTGIGIPKEEQGNIFHEYYRAQNAMNFEETGSGIGLMITRRIVKQHHGTISFSSVEGQGTTFTVTFPQRIKASVAVEAKADGREEAQAATGAVHEETERAGKNVLLLAEDDADMREYLVDSLSSEYKVVAVPDGGKALETAREINPDIIISDIVMPVLEGDELCRILKSSVDTSHIPIILLTALSERENIIFGLEAGANDYIIKPFDLSVLKVRIRNILQNRQHLRETVLAMDAQPEETDYTSQLDKEFLDKVMKVIEEELSDSEFSINDFCRMLGMSRTSVYNKIKTLTGQGPNDFIRIVRLNKAKELLVSRKYSIGEVANMVGFSDPKYFSTCFKKQFGTSPSKI